MKGGRGKISADSNFQKIANFWFLKFLQEMHIHDWILKIKNVSPKYPLHIIKNYRQHNSNKDLYMLSRIEKDAKKKKSEVYSAHMSENYHKENSNKNLLVRSSIRSDAEKKKSKIYFFSYNLQEFST